MAFTFVRNMISGMAPIAPPGDNVGYEVDETSMVAGQVAKFTSGLLKHATDDEVNAAVILLEAGDDGEDVRCMWILPGAVFKTTVNEGTAASVVVGGSYEIADDYLGLNETNPGPLTVIKIDPDDDDVVWVLFNSCLLASATKNT